MVQNSQYKRHIAHRLKEATDNWPAVLVHGPRQCGKTTLTRMVCEPAEYAYISFDDETILETAKADPVGFVNGLPSRVILDEVQLVPNLFRTLKLAIDNNRQNGRFIMTGSVNVLRMREITDSLAGRMQILQLHPLSQCEMAGKSPLLLDALFSNFPNAIQNDISDDSVSKRIVLGGYPAAIKMPNELHSANWYRNYVETLIQRDAMDIAKIRAFDALPRLLNLAATQTAQLLNVSRLANEFQLSRPTIDDYVIVLEKLFLLQKLLPWYSKQRTRLIKTPKLHLTDSGLICAMLNADSLTLNNNRTLLGHLLETFVLQELQRQASAYDVPHTFFHYREKDGAEVDIVIERKMQAVGVEVKASATVRNSDFRSLRKLKSIVGNAFAGGAVIYNGPRLLSFGDNLYAVPLNYLWTL